MFQGKLVFVEGGDGAGKTTFINHLKEICADVVFLREPGGQGMSHLVRTLVLSDEAKSADPLTMFHLFWASRAENFATVVLPALKSGKIVISDRFDASTYAYQIGENPKLEDLFWTTRETCLQGVSPVYLYFDVSIETSKKRMKNRGDQNHFDVRSDSYRARVRSHYDKFFQDKRIRSIKVDADLPQDRMISCGMEALETILQI